LFSAEHGKGAWLNGKLIRVGNQNNLERCLLASEFSYNQEIWLKVMEDISYFLPRSQGIRIPGAVVLDLCNVACGRFDGFWTRAAHPWDFAAGALIAMEAGAIVSNVDGKPDFLHGKCSILAANPQIYSMMLEALKSSAR
jgi:myo-inositol-1(or 4)-monophosphatase